MSMGTLGIGILRSKPYEVEISMRHDDGEHLAGFFSPDESERIGQDLIKAAQQARSNKATGVKPEVTIADLITATRNGIDPDELDKMIDTVIEDLFSGLFVRAARPSSKPAFESSPAERPSPQPEPRPEPRPEFTEATRAGRAALDALTRVRRRSVPRFAEAPIEEGVIIANSIEELIAKMNAQLGSKGGQG